MCPTQAKRALTNGSVGKKHDVSPRMNPFHLDGGFNGDGAMDVALLIKERATGKHGIAVVHGTTGKITIVGAALASATAAMISTKWIRGRFTPRRVPPTP